MRDVLNAETRTLQAVIHVPNSGTRLRPGMFATVRISVPVSGTAGSGAGSTPGVTLPESAVVTDAEGRIVFVQVAPRTYVRRQVEIAGRSGGRVFVRSGVLAGEQVVVQGAFTLKSELQKAGLEGHGH
jgi:multidrug efflux pump subunit AcrA (membrane-fusion protein)